MFTPTEDYVSFETAKLLKEKGFKGNTDGTYNDDGVFYLYKHEKGYNHNHLHTWYSAPTLQTAMKWLREVHNIHINLDIHWFHFANSNGWMYLIEKILENGVEYIDSRGDENDKTFFSTYEEAYEAAIKYCLKHLI